MYSKRCIPAISNITTKKAQRQAMRRELRAMQKRDAQLEALFERIYENNASGQLPTGNFLKYQQNMRRSRSNLPNASKP